MYKDYAITGDQMKAIKAVERAMNIAKKHGVHFWDNYGEITAFNWNVINCPVPDENSGSPLNSHHIYSLRVKNVHAGNADDSLFVTFK